MRGRVWVLLVLLVPLPAGAPPAGAQAAPSGTPWGPWLSLPLDADDVPQGDGRHFRIRLEARLPSDAAGLEDVAVTGTVDVAEALASAGYPRLENGQLKGFRLDLDSLVLYEVDAFGDPVEVRSDGTAAPTPAAIFPGSLDGAVEYDAAVNPQITVNWVLSGPTTAARYYDLYLDTMVHGPKSPLSFPPAEVARLASLVGPGRGTRLYVPHADQDAAGSARLLRLTNLQDAPAKVTVFPYTRFNVPDTTPYVEDLTIPGPRGTSVTLAHPPGRREGGLLVESDRPIFGEAVHRGTLASFEAGSTDLFLPAATGGFTGTSFATTAAVPSRLSVFCPAAVQAADVGGCEVRLGAAAPTVIPRNGFTDFAVGSGSVVRLDALQGNVLVERSAADDRPDRRALTPWPAADGPTTARYFVGRAGASDRLLLDPMDADASLLVRDLSGARSTLEESWSLPRGLLTEDPAAWGTQWDRAWAGRGFGEAPTHAKGPVRLENRVPGRLVAASGHVADDSRFSAFVPLQSPNGGLDYAFPVPADANGAALGRITLFAPYAGTGLVVERLPLSGAGAPVPTEYPPLQAHERVDLPAEPGRWRLRADRPVLAAWVKTGDDPAGGIVPALTSLGTVRVLGAQFSGYLFDVEVAEDFLTVAPNGVANFEIEVRNLARSAEGTPLPNTVRLELVAPTGWNEAEVAPGTVPLQASGQGSVRSATASIVVPPNVDAASGGATILLRAHSDADPKSVRETSLRINFRVQRGVLLTANGFTVEAVERVRPNEAATYQVRLTNTGTAEDRFDVQFSDAVSNWRIVVRACFTATGSAAPCSPATGGVTPFLPSGAILDYEVEVTPLNDRAFRSIVSILATSQTDRSAQSAVRLQTNLETNRAFRAIVDEPLRVVEPGNRTTFVVRLFNDADVDEELAVAVSNELPSPWTAPNVSLEVRPGEAPVPLSATGAKAAVPAVESRRLFVTVEVPSNTTPLTLGLVRLSLRSTIAQDTAARDLVLRTVAAEQRIFSATLLPPEASLLPGGRAATTIAVVGAGNALTRVRIDAQVPTDPPGWAVLGADGQAAGRLFANVTPGATRRLDVEVAVPASAPPSLSQGYRIAFILAAEGAVTREVEFRVLVGEKIAARASPGSAYVAPGARTPVRIEVENTGNTELLAQGAWDSLPLGWSGSFDPVVLLPGRKGVATGNLSVPSSTPVGQLMATFLLRDEQGRELARAAWRLLAGRATLEASATSHPGFSQGTRAWTISLRNSGDAPAYGLRVVLERSGAALDEARLLELLPGVQTQVTLIAPDVESGVTLLVSSVADATSARVELAAPSSPTSAQGGAPGFPLAVLLAAAAVAFARRREVGLR